MISEDAKRLLAEPLHRDAVKTREQSGRKLSYIEGWHAIAEANRIFGFDGWSRETVDIKCVSEGPRTMKSGQGHGVSYIAKVRINVDGVIREGCGTGHGIDRDLGQAHESALKEAETDAMKRALMTFGNPFGLALYDKTQSEVVDAAPRPKPVRTAPAKVDPLVQQAGIICNEPGFWTFLAVANADMAAQVVRDRCRISSRSELATNAGAAALWRGLVSDYRLWQRDQVEKSAPAEDVPTARVYTELWRSIIESAVPSKRAQIHKTWNDQKDLRSKIEWTPDHPFLPLKERVARALQFLKESA